MMTTLHSPNDHLRVTNKGIYEIIEVCSRRPYIWTKLNFFFWQVTDSQCPGMVLGDGSTYKVDWIPRPSAKLSPLTEATYAAHNGSHILQPICEGMNGHVDLDLTGMLPSI
jgi:nucleoporin POM152